MRSSVPRAAIVLSAMFLAFFLGGLTRPAQAAQPAFCITIDRDAWRKFEFRYPATYVFALGDDAQEVEVRRRDAAGDTWSTLDVKTADDAPNGVECVRFDPTAAQGVRLRRLPDDAGGSPRIPGDEPCQVRGDRQILRRAQGGLFALDGQLGLQRRGRIPARRGKARPTTSRTTTRRPCTSAAASTCRCRSPSTAACSAARTVWQSMQTELDRRDFSWEPAVHGRTHPCSVAAYSVHGYGPEILGCRDDILSRLHNIPYGQYIFEHILTYGYQDESIFQTDAGEFLFVRGFNWLDNPESIDYVPWNAQYGFYGVGGLNYKGYDAVFQSREPEGRYYAADVQKLNDAFDQVYRTGDIFYALWHPDRYRNSVIYDPRPGVDGVQGSTLMQHLAHVANRKDVWYVANGWLYCYRYVAEHARVQPAAAVGVRVTRSLA